jgi:hypothetical protein
MNHQAIYATHPTVVTIDDTAGAFDAAGNPVTIDEAAVAAKAAELEADYEAKQYQRDRAAEYPSVNDYLDGIVKGDQAQIDAYIAACQAVKAKYPKPE